MAPIPRTVVILGSGPGIATSVATLFTQKYFRNIALLARNEERLRTRQQTVIKAAASVNKDVEVRTCQVDIADLDELQTTLLSAQSLGVLNASCSTGRGGRRAHYLLFRWGIFNWTFEAKWAYPLLSALATSDPEAKPAFLVPTSLLPQAPIPELFSSSLAKSAHGNLVLSLADMLEEKGIHIGWIVIGGAVSPPPRLNPEFIAKRTWEFFAERKRREIEILE